MVFCRILFRSGSKKVADYLVISKIHLNFASIFSQKILKKSERHSHQQSLFLYDKGADATQGNEKFSDKKSLNYLAVPNNFITLSLSHRRTVAYLLNTHFILRARDMLRNPFRQRTYESFLCSFFRALLYCQTREDKNDFNLLK